MLPGTMSYRYHVGMISIPCGAKNPTTTWLVAIENVVLPLHKVVVRGVSIPYPPFRCAPGSPTSHGLFPRSSHTFPQATAQRERQNQTRHPSSKVPRLQVIKCHKGWFLTALMRVVCSHAWRRVLVMKIRGSPSFKKRHRVLHCWWDKAKPKVWGFEIEREKER